MNKIKKPFLWVIFFGFVSILLLITFRFAAQKRVSFWGKASIQKAEVWIMPTSAEINVNETYSFKVFLNTNNQEISGMDLVLKYEPQLIEIVDNTIKPGVIFNYYTGRLVDNRKGIIKLSSEGRFTGQGTFATFQVKGKGRGTTVIQIITPKVSLDSTIVWDKERKENILGNTHPASLSVR